jgi:ketosteroid isomerase-like protein
VTAPAPASAVAAALQQLSDAGSDADPAEFDRLLADDVTWQLMGYGLDYTRTYHGKAEVYGQYLGKLQARLDHARTKTSTVSVLADDQRGAVAVHNSDQLFLLDGTELVVDVVLLMTVSEGRVQSVREFMDLRPVEAVFGSSFDEPTPSP